MKILIEVLKYFHRIGDALSQLANVIFLFGNPNESISGRMFRINAIGVKSVINALFFWEKNHCKTAYMSDLSYASEVMRRHITIKRERGI